MTQTIRKLSYVDPVLLAATLALIILGMVMVYSASSPIGMERYGDGAYFLKRHLIAAAVGLVAMGLAFFIKTRWIKNLALPGLVLSGVLLLITAFTSAGHTAKASTRWLGLGGFTFQPSEIAKPLIIAYVAAYLAHKREGIRDFLRGLFPLLLTMAAFILLILRQPDFGTSVLMVAVVGAMLFVARAKTWHLAGLATLGLLAGVFLVKAVAYRQRRVLAFMDPWVDPRGAGFQIIQSFIAFEHGGLEGQGLGDGTQKLLYLPEAHTDFIYSVIAEELGVLGSIAVIVLFACLVVQGLRLALRIGEPFAAQLAFGITALIGFQSLFNMAVVMGMLPTKGMTLPLVSYGGTSLITTMASIGILLSISATVSQSKYRPTRRAL